MLSVVIPSYNHGVYLHASLEALLAQTRPADEIIVIDDASTDDSVAVASSFVDRHPNFRFVRNCRNLGCVPTLNRGLALARGSIVYFGAADDLTEPILFARGVALLEAYPQAALFSARSYVIDAKGQGLGLIPTPIPLPVPGFIDRDTAARVLMREDGWFMGNTTLYRRAPLLSIEGFPEELGSFTDGYVSRVLALGHGACFSPEVLAAWRRLEGGFAWSHTVDRERMVPLMEAARRKMTEPTSPFPTGYAERWQRRYLFGARRFGLIRETAAGSDTRHRRAPRCGGARMRPDGVAFRPAAAVGSAAGCAAAASKPFRHEPGLGALAVDALSSHGPWDTSAAIGVPCENTVDNRAWRSPQFTLKHPGTGENAMIDLYFWPTGNGKKSVILLEELGLPYTIKPINIGRGDQLTPEFLKISPNGRMPAIVDHEPMGGGAPLSIFESGPIMTYLAEKTGRFCPQDTRGKYDVAQWVGWQLANQGPKLGEQGHFRRAAESGNNGDLTYALRRFDNETHRIFGVMNLGLFNKRYFAAGQYTIADMICYPWASSWATRKIDIDEFPNVKRWLEEIGARPAVKKAMAMGPEFREDPATISAEEQARRRKLVADQRAQPIPAQWVQAAAE